MLKPPKPAGAEQLRLYVHELTFERCVKILDVHPSTLRGWLREARPVPQAALKALYWLTHWGFSAACSEAHWSHQVLLGQVRQVTLERDRARTVGRVLGLVAAGRVNTPSRAAPSLLP